MPSESSGGGFGETVSIVALLGLAVPLLVAALTQVVSVYNQNKQSKRDFELKVVEVLMAEGSPEALRNKARAFKTLFPHLFPADFAANFNTREFEGSGGTVAAKKFLLGLIAEHPGQKELILRTWRQLFPSDTWLDDVN
jgi:hypothetical protein